MKVTAPCYERSSVSDRDISAGDVKDRLAASTYPSTKLREAGRAATTSDGLGKPERPHQTTLGRYCTQEVAGSSPASSTQNPLAETTSTETTTTTTTTPQVKKGSRSGAPASGIGIAALEDRRGDLDAEAARHEHDVPHLVDDAAAGQVLGIDSTMSSEASRR